MLDQFKFAWEECKPALRKQFCATPPETYAELVKITLTALAHEMESNNCLGAPSTKTLYENRFGSYDGTLIYVFENADDSSSFYAVRIYYGSCPGCDTLQHILMNMDSDEFGTPHVNETTLNDFMTLALHIVQEIKEI